MRSDARRIPALLRRGGRSPVVGGSTPPPVNSVAPVASGTVTIGGSLSVTNGTWTNASTFAYQWRRAGVNIGGATASTYTVVAADIGPAIDCVVTATGSGGSAAADSNDLAYTPDGNLALSAVYDAATPTAGAITAWSDTSGRAQHLNVGAATAVASGFNGGSQPYVQFNGSSDYLQRNAFDWGASLTAVSIGMVYVLDVATNGATVMRYGGTGTRPNLVQATSFRPQAATFGATTQTPAVNALQAPRVATVRATRLASKRYNIPGTVDPADQTDGSDTHTDDATLVFGAAAGGASGWSQMKVAMIWVVNRSISDAELTDWVTYAGWRWGVPTS